MNNETETGESGTEAEDHATEDENENVGGGHGHIGKKRKQTKALVGPRMEVAGAFEDELSAAAIHLHFPLGNTPKCRSTDPIE